MALEIGSGPWQPELHGHWVSKTDLLQLLRCPYRVLLHFRDGTSYEDFVVPELRVRFFEPGIEWERDVFTRTEVPSVDSLEEARASAGFVAIRPLIRNHALGLVGRPDMVIMDKGRIVPVEIKARSKLQLDELRLELSFYHQLLEPAQDEPVGLRRWGYVILLDGKPQRVSLRQEDIKRAKKMTSEVRNVASQGVGLAFQQSCQTCTRKSEHLRAILGEKDISLIWQVGRDRVRWLRELEVCTLSDLAESDVTMLHTAWRERDRYAPGLEDLSRMKAHAIALLTGETQVIRKESLPSISNALFLDLEYDSSSPRQVFVMGALRFDEGREVSLHQEFAEDAADEQRVLVSLARLLGKLPGHRVVTWNGVAADLPALADAWSRLNLDPAPLASLRLKHMDVYQLATRSFRFPSVGFGLLEVAACLGCDEPPSETAGWEMPMLYRRYLRGRDAELRREMLGHNEADLRALAWVWERLRDLGP